MTKFFHLIAFCALAFLLLSCASSDKNLKVLEEAGKVPLTHSEMEALFSRPRSATWKNVKGHQGTSEYSPDGTVSVDWGSGSDTGVWWIDDGQYCSQYKNVREGAEYCFNYVNVGENKYYYFQEGKYRGETSFTN